MLQGQLSWASHGHMAAFREPLEQRPATRLPHFTCFSSIFIFSSYLEIYISELHLQGHVLQLFLFELTRTFKTEAGLAQMAADEGRKLLSCSYLTDATRPRPRRCTKPSDTMRRRCSGSNTTECSFSVVSRCSSASFRQVNTLKFRSKFRVRFSGGRRHLVEVGMDVKQMTHKLIHTVFIALMHARPQANIFNQENSGPLFKIHSISTNRKGEGQYLH